MIRSIILSGTLFWILLLLVACDDAGDSDNHDTVIEGNGSCTSTRSGEQYCYEIEEEYPEFKSECTLFSGGSWSASSCEQSLYARVCIQETEVSQNNESPIMVHYVYYFIADSNMGCIGEETEL